MASSFLSQIPQIIFLISQLKPKSILDIGKGFGKYGFLIHEYIGIDNTKGLDPNKTMREQSNCLIDAVEIDEQLFLPHLNHIYNKIYSGSILDIYRQLPAYNLILMIDVVEHLEKNAAIKMLEHFTSQKNRMIIATPAEFFQQHLYNSSYEEHISHWQLADFRKICNVEYQKIDGGIIYYLSPEKAEIRGFGNSAMQKIRRIARCLRNEL